MHSKPSNIDHYYHILDGFAPEKWEENNLKGDAPVFKRIWTVFVKLGRQRTQEKYPFTYAGAPKSQRGV